MKWTPSIHLRLKFLWFVRIGHYHLAAVTAKVAQLLSLCEFGQTPLYSRQSLAQTEKDS
ncbi:MAG: hypothetical protein WBQ74_18690 [Candidatus Sulfotelmatobacter sp.]